MDKLEEENPLIIENKDDIDPCDLKTRCWASRMFIFITIFILLCSMVFSTFNHYSIMLSQMDTLEDNPKVISMYDSCHNQSYNILVNDENLHMYEIASFEESEYYIQTFPYNLSYDSILPTLIFNTSLPCYAFIIWRLV